MLESVDYPLTGAHALVIGRSNIVGKPMAIMLLEKNATVTVAHSKTKNLKELALQADVIVAAVGKEKVVTADMVKPGAVVEYAILGEGCRIGRNCRLGGTPEETAPDPWGLTVLAPGCVLEDEKRVRPGVMLNKNGEEVSR